jgi:hypothetical protein
MSVSSWGTLPHPSKNNEPVARRRWLLPWPSGHGRLPAPGLHDPIGRSAFRFGRGAACPEAGVLVDQDGLATEDVGCDVIYRELDGAGLA